MVPLAKRLAVPAIAIITISMMAPLPVAASGARDITGTERGQSIAVDAAARFTLEGVATDPSDLVVTEYQDGTVIVAPESLQAGLLLSTTATDGVKRLEGTVNVGSADVMPSAESASVETIEAAPYWQRRETGCFAALYLKTARFDVCYRIHQLINDGVPSKDYWSLEQWGTAFESATGLRSAFVSGTQRSGTNAQAWEDWSPPSSLTKNCTTYWIGVDYIASIGQNFEVCEKWTLTKSAGGTTPYIKVEWGCNASLCGFGPGDRDVAYAMETSLATGKTPQYTLGYGMDHW